MQKKIVIWGASGHALVVANIVKLTKRYDLVGFIDDINLESKGNSFSGFPILGGKEQLENLLVRDIKHLIFGFGCCLSRLKLSEFIREMGFSLASAIHPQAIVEDGVTIGDGTVIFARAVVNPGTSIGENVIINTCASIDHECFIADGAHICPGVTLGGRVSVGRATWIGIGATVKDGVNIGAGALIGAGSVVLRDIPDNVIAYGVPAKVIKSNLLLKTKLSHDS